MDNLCIAMAKGRLAKEAVKLFRQAGYDLPENMLKSRKLIFEIESEKFGVEEPAVGFALEIENLLDYLNRTENFSQESEKRFLISYAEKKDFKLAFELAEDLRNANFVAEVLNRVDREYLDFQQVDYEIILKADKVELIEKSGEKTVIRRNQKEAIEYLILNKIGEWE